MHQIDLTQLGNGKSAKIIFLQGNTMFIAKLESIGIHLGTIIMKKSAALGKGPIILKKGTLQFAIGYGMAQKIIVEPISTETRRAS